MFFCHENGLKWKLKLTCYCNFIDYIQVAIVFINPIFFFFECVFSKEHHSANNSVKKMMINNNNNQNYIVHGINFICPWCRLYWKLWGNLKCAVILDIIIYAICYNGIWCFSVCTVQTEWQNHNRFEKASSHRKYKGYWRNVAATAVGLLTITIVVWLIYLFIRCC